MLKTNIADKGWGAEVALLCHMHSILFSYNVLKDK